jgi:hypothetical protein
VEQSEAEWQQRGSLTVGEEAEVADADEAARQQVQKEAAQELVDRKCHDALPVAMRGVSPAKGHRTIGESNESAVGDADAVGISTEVAQDMLRSAEWPLRIDDPIVTEQASEPSSEAAWLSQRCEMAVELEMAILKRSLQPCDELAAENAGEHPDRKEERPARSDPACMIRSEAAGGDHAVDMGMVLQALVPGMEHAEEADLCAEVPWVTSNLLHRRGTGVEKKAVQDALVLGSNSGSRC